jgi:hypothetical protein
VVTLQSNMQAMSGAAESRQTTVEQGGRFRHHSGQRRRRIQGRRVPAPP